MKEPQALPGITVKWPQMLVSGTPVTTKQALEIIRRTDTFFQKDYNGNNRRWIAWVKETVGFPKDSDLRESDSILDCFRKQELWRTRWGIVDTSYVNNSWVSTSFIGGPHGWCHPDGTIYFDDNVGKWPDMEAIVSDWKTLAEAFPFLDLRVALHNHESCEDCIVGHGCIGGQILVKDGKVISLEEFDAALLPTARRSPEQQPPELLESLGRIVSNRECESAISPAVIEVWAKQHPVNLKE